MACGRTNNSEQVDFIMSAMKMAGVQPDEIAYGAAIDAHRRAGMLKANSTDMTSLITPHLLLCCR